MSLKAYKLRDGSDDFDILISTKFNTIERHWLQTDVGLFLSPGYLKGLEGAIPLRCSLIYIVIKKDSEFIGQAVFQTVVLDGKKDFKPEEHLNDGKKSVFRCLFDFLSKGLIKRAKINILIAGNMMNVGTNFFYFKAIERKRQFSIIDQMVKLTIKYLKEEKGTKYNVSLIKELKKNREQEGIRVIKECGYYPFEVEPNMLINITWEDFEGYLSSMRSKYRVRYKRAVKKLKGLKSVELDLGQIILLKDRMFDLYNTIANQAQFNLIDLNANYHVSLKKELGELYRVYGYFDLEGTLIGFYTLLVNGKHIDAGYLGLESTANKNYQLYLNMLYDMVRKAILMKADKLILARTALEIKSSIGAVPEEKVLFLKNHKSVYHQPVTQVLKVLNRPTEWTQRHPFG